MKKDVIFFLLLTCIFFCFSFSAWAQSHYIEGKTSSPRKLSISVLEIIEPETGESNSALKNIIQTSAEISLRERALNTYIYNKKFDYNKVLSSQESVRNFLNHIQDDFVLIITYSSIEKNRVKLNLYWLNKLKERITKTESTEIYLNFEFDRRVSHLVSRLLKEVDPEIKSLKEGIERKKREIKEQKAAAIPQLKTEHSRKYGVSKQIHRSALYKSETMVLLPPKFYSISSGFSPFLPTGEAEDYFYLGMNPTLSLSYHSKIPTGYLGLGLIASVNYFFAVGFNGAADIFLTQIGTNISYVSNPIFNLPVGLFLYVAEGPAILTVNLNRNQLQSTVLGFVKGGTGLAFFLTDESGLIIDVGYGISIGRNDSITGISPELFLYTKM